jgi:hypothetical protein
MIEVEIFFRRAYTWRFGGGYVIRFVGGTTFKIRAVHTTKSYCPSTVPKEAMTLCHTRFLMKSSFLHIKYGLSSAVRSHGCTVFGPPLILFDLLRFVDHQKLHYCMTLFRSLELSRPWCGLLDVLLTEFVPTQRHQHTPFTAGTVNLDHGVLKKAPFEADSCSLCPCQIKLHG